MRAGHSFARVGGVELNRRAANVTWAGDVHSEKDRGFNLSSRLRRFLHFDSEKPRGFRAAINTICGTVPSQEIGAAPRGARQRASIKQLMPSNAKVVGSGTRVTGVRVMLSR